MKSARGSAVSSGLLALALSAACATSQGQHRAPGKADFFYVQPDPERASCLLVLPFANLSNVDRAGRTVGRLFADQIGRDPKFNTYERSQLAPLLSQVGLDLATLDTETSLELARLLGADAILFGTVGGSWSGGGNADDNTLWVDGRLLGARGGDVLWAASDMMRRGDSAAKEPNHALNLAVDGMVSRLRQQLRPRRIVAKTACLRPEIRAQVLAEPTDDVDDIEERMVVASGVPDAVSSAFGAILVARLRAATQPIGADSLSEPAQELAEQLQRGEAVLLEEVRFEEHALDNLTLGGDQLEALGEVMSNRPDVYLRVKVHTDSSGNLGDDVELTDGQALKLIDALARRWQIDRQRMQGVGVGSKHPVQPNITRRGRLANRRVEVLAIAGDLMRKNTASAHKPPPPPLPKMPDMPASDGDLGGKAQELLARLENGESLRLEGVEFPQRTALKPKLDGPMLEALGELIVARPEMRLEVQVHVDTSGDLVKDIRLTQKQALALSETLMSRWNIQPSRLEVSGKGSTNPRQPNITRRGREANRRVEVSMLLE